MVLGSCTLSQNGYGNASKHVIYLGLMGLINYVINGISALIMVSLSPISGISALKQWLAVSGISPISTQAT